MADAAPILERVLRAMRLARIEAILVGNAAAAIQGAPVTTDDFDFLFRPTPKNKLALRQMAQTLRAHLEQPQYPLSRFYRITPTDGGFQVDMMGRIDGVRSFESLRSRATRSQIRDEQAVVASLEDVIKSKRAAGRPKDFASLPVLEATLREKKKIEGK